MQCAEVPQTVKDSATADQVVLATSAGSHQCVPVSAGEGETAVVVQAGEHRAVGASHYMVWLATAHLCKAQH